MNIISLKFQAKTKSEFIAELREKVNTYFETHNISKYSNASMILKSVFMVSLYLVPYTMMITGLVTSYPGIIISFLIMGLGMAGVGMGLMHDANHGSYSKNRRLNRLLGQSLYLLGGLPANWLHQHNTMHHGYTNIDGLDEDIAPIGILRFSPHRPLYKIHKFQHMYAWFFYGLMSFSWITSKDFTQLFRYKKDKIKLANSNSFGFLFVKLIVSKVLYYFLFLGLPMVILPIEWYWILLAFLAMHFICGLILATVFQTAHVVPSSEYPLPDETGSMENNWAVHQLITTSNFSPRSRVLSWFIGGLNYQIEHHLFPNICHVHYKRISHFVRETAMKYGLPYHVQPTFIIAVRQHANMLRMLGRN